MSVIKHEWWATPVWEIETGFDSTFNQNLLTEITDCRQEPGKPFNIWDYKTPSITALKEKIMSSVIEHTSSYFSLQYGYNPTATRGWVNYQRPGNILDLHDHGDSVLACTYYINVPENSGDLKVIDPRGYISSWELVKEGYVDGLKHKRITPKVSKLVMFPGYLLHSVEMNRSNQVRIGISTNIHNRPFTTTEK